MTSNKFLLLMVSTSMLLTACTLDPRAYESPPVEVETAKGVVICQLYTKERVLWDRAIDRPQKMDVEESDDICREAGQRWKDSPE